MAHTFHQHYYHLVWSTKERQPLILNEYKDRIFEFLGGSLRTLGCVSLQAGGLNMIKIISGNKLARTPFWGAILILTCPGLRYACPGLQALTPIRGCFLAACSHYHPSGLIK
jgi:hypothetical protein